VASAHVQAFGNLFLVGRRIFLQQQLHLVCQGLAVQALHHPVGHHAQMPRHGSIALYQWQACLPCRKNDFVFACFKIRGATQQLTIGRDAGSGAMLEVDTVGREGATADPATQVQERRENGLYPLACPAMKAGFIAYPPVRFSPLE